MAYQSVHVKYNYNYSQWCVNIEHEAMPRSHRSTKGAAEQVGRGLAARMKTELIVHDHDGTVSARTSYASDSL